MKKLTRLIAGVLAGVMLLGTTVFAKEEMTYDDVFYKGFAEDEVIIANTDVIWYTVPNKLTPANIGIRVAGVTNKGNLVVEGFGGEIDSVFGDYICHDYTVWTPDKLSPTFNPAYGTQQIDQATAYERLIALKTTFPEGMSWTEANTYTWTTADHKWEWSGIGCSAYAMQISDLVFGVSAPVYSHCDVKNIKVGDILEMYGINHAVVALEVHDDYVIVTEGNYNGVVHWGWKIKKSDLAKWETNITTRY